MWYTANMHTQGIPLNERILNLLQELDVPTKKETLAAKLESTVFSVAKCLTTLKAGNLIKENQGWYTVTSNGKTVNDPSTVAFATKAPAFKKEVDELTVKVSMDCVKGNTQCWAVVTYQDNIKGDETLAAELLPFVLMYMVCMGQTLPQIDEPNNEPNDPIRDDALNNWFEEIGKLWE